MKHPVFLLFRKAASGILAWTLKCGNVLPQILKNVSGEVIIAFLKAIHKKLKKSLISGHIF